MMNCVYCQAVMNPQDQFCTKCGRARPVVLGSVSYPPQPPRTRNTKKIALLIVGNLIVIAALIGTIAFVYAATRPNPTIAVTSVYHLNELPAGASSTTLSVRGLHFSGNEAINFFLDGGQVFNLPPLESDGSGAFTFTLPIGKDWTIGKHVLTASDADHYLTKQGSAIEVVAAGEADTPGPNDAPPDSASFKIKTTFSGTVLDTGDPYSGSETLTVTGQPDPAGGAVCGEHDDGLPYVQHSTLGGTGSLAGTPYTETETRTCAGTYQGGHLSETVTVTSDHISFFDPYGNQAICTTQAPYDYSTVQGTFTSPNEISGTFSTVDVRYTCSNNDWIIIYATAGSWSGSVA